MIQALTFDLDDTLLDGGMFRDSVLQTCNLLATTAGLDAARLLEANNRVWQNYWPEVEKKWTIGEISGRTVSQEAWRRTLLQCGREDNSLAQLATETHAQQRSKAIRLFDDVRELTELKRRFRLALITNGASDTQRGSLRILGIGNLFDVVIISGEVGVAKPDPKIFNLALQKLGVASENAWHLGDSLTTDVTGAHAAGLGAVWVNRAGVARKEGDPKPDHEIRSLTELPRLLSEREKNSSSGKRVGT